MKWLRSSLFKNNSNTFTFEEKININVNHYNASLKNIKDVIVSGTLTRGGKDKIYADLKIIGVFEMISGRTLNSVELPFEILEKEEYIDKSLIGNDIIDVNLMDMYIDLKPLVHELIILNIPITSSADEQMELVSGKDWKLLSEDTLVDLAKKKESPFAALNGLFKEQ
ncbi:MULTISPECIES: YceD family protein [Gemella]|uniref:YceD family protein n=1 Tax=Gemella TaxID=1378 RepID=UPI00076831FB|nr:MULTISPECIES: YceD family protein [Gemella]AME08837.1 hypothetical protein AXE85_00825 [Gemella sp. oral taxon 928]AXI26406.1 hypothetical protein CG018_02580 [Gemella sp. ND 6198]